ncbi:MAG TPA: invasion associated locus B family protein [Vicinamibacterales bacterium]|jgi:invasion protein IalB
MSRSTTRSIRLLAVIAAVCLTTVGVLAGQQPPPRPPVSGTQTLPGGASQMQETHGDWRVTCAQPNGQKVCTLSQQLADQNSRQLVLGIELVAKTPDTGEGTLIMPFGLALDKGVTLQVDDNGAPMVKTFRTCVPAGCLVSLSLDSAQLTALRKGTVLNVKATADGGKETAFKISLTGFGSAFDRTSVLSR